MTTNGTPVAAGPPTPEDEDAAVAYVVSLVRAEEAGERCKITLGPYQLFTLIGAVQLALRHPTMGGNVSKTLTDLIEQIRVPFTGTPGDGWITKGYYREFDGDGQPGHYGSFEEWLARKYPDPVGRQCIEAGEADLHEAFYAGRASVRAGKAIS